MTDPPESAEAIHAALARIRADVESRLSAVGDAAGVEALRTEVLGRSGTLTVVLRALSRLSEAERPAAGAAANETRVALEQAIADREHRLAAGELAEQIAGETLDMTAPGRPVRLGHLHPLMTVERDLREIFHAFGFEVFEGPEVENDLMNFELLNIPPDHPSRDLWDTLYVAEPGSVEAGEPRPAADGTILRTHTSPVQIRAMRELVAPDPGPHAGALLSVRGGGRRARVRVLPGRGARRRSGHQPG